MKLDLIEINKILQGNYNLKNIIVQKNLESTEGNVYNITTSDNKYILKIYRDIKHVDNMKNLYEMLKKDFYIPQIIKNNNRELYTAYNEYYFIIYSYLEGNQLSNYENIPNEISIIFANELRQFHNKTEKMNNINLKNIDFCSKTLRTSLLHFDLTRGNIFYNKGQIGFIDFDDAKYGQSIIDISIAIINLYCSKLRGVDLEGIKTFITEYYKDDYELKKEEIYLISEIAIKWVDHILNNNEFECSTKESLQIKKKLIKTIDFSMI